MAQTDLGTVQVRNEVIGSIAALAAKEVQGVVDVWKGSQILTLLPFWPNHSGVRVESTGLELSLSLSLVVEYGVSLPDVAAQVQDRVRDRVEEMTHIAPLEVQVKVHHVKPKRS